mgnify:CR=1 FL=1|jgi:hypothetical protein
MREKIIKNLENLKQASIKLKESLQEFKELSDKGKEISTMEDFRETVSSDEIAFNLAWEINEITKEIEGIYDSLKK